MSALPPGKALCPGWSSEYAKDSDFSWDEKKTRIFECGASSAGRRKADPTVVSVISGQQPQPCSRCRRQKTKFDEERGAKQAREKKQRDDYDSLIAAYVLDLEKAGVSRSSSISAAIAGIGELVMRSGWPPHARQGDAGYRSTWNDPKVDARDKINVLRKLAGLALDYPTYR